MHDRIIEIDKGDLIPRRREPRIGLALSAGAARGLAHIGVIQVLEELDIPIYAVAGCSMGAYIGALWNYGCDGQKMKELAATINRPIDLLSLIDPAFPPGRGLIRGHKIKARLQKTIGDVLFPELQRPLRIVATRLDAFERVIFSHGKVADAVHASLAIPGVCVPVELNGASFSDGAILDPLPVDVLRQMGCDYIIAVSVIPKVTEIGSACGHLSQGGKRSLLQAVNPFSAGNFIDTLRRSVLSAEIRLAGESGQKADVLIAPSVRARGWHDYRQWDFYIHQGREAALSQREKLLALCSNRFPDIATTTTHQREAKHYDAIKA